MTSNSRIRWVGRAAFFVVLIALAGAAQAGSLDMFKGESGVVKIAGGTAHIPVMKEAAARIMRINPAVRITIAGGGSSVGIKQVGQALVDIGNSGRRPTEQEIARYGLKMFKWAIDGVAAVVNPHNPVRSLSAKQLQNIFAGITTSWKALGGPDKPINVYTRDIASGTRAVFWKKALSKGAITDRANFVVSNGAMKAAIANDPYGIGYVSVGHIDSSVAPVAIDGVLPTLANVKAGKYTVARGLYSNTRGEPKGLTRKFIEFLFSAEGQKIVADKGFIPVR